MESSNIKNLIICLLVLVNLFLAGLAGADSLRSSRNRSASEAAVRTILEDNGIQLTAKDLPEQGDLKSWFVSRDLQQEKAMVSGLLGSTTVQDLGGGILYYYGEKGQAKFRSTGEFVLLFDRGAVPVDQDPETTARAVLKKMGIRAQLAQSSPGRGDGGDPTVVMTVLYDDTPVMNCQISFSFATDALLMVEGRRVPDICREDPAVTALDPATLLTRFVGLVNRNGYVCSEIRDIRVVLQYSDTGGGKLVPVWEIETDARTYYLNVSTGEEQSVV